MTNELKRRSRGMQPETPEEEIPASQIASWTYDGRLHRLRVGDFVCVVIRKMPDGDFLVESMGHVGMTNDIELAKAAGLDFFEREQVALQDS